MINAGWTISEFKSVGLERYGAIFDFYIQNSESFLLQYSQVSGKKFQKIKNNQEIKNSQEIKEDKKGKESRTADTNYKPAGEKKSDSNLCCKIS